MPYDRPQDPQLIAGFYEAAARPDMWPDVWEQMRQAFSAETGVLSRQPGSTAPGAVVATHDWSDKATQLYRDHYARLDPMLAHALANPGSRAFLSQDVVPPEQALRSELYNEFALPHAGGAFHTLCAIIRLDGADFARVGLHRPVDGAAFNETDRRNLDALTRHIAGALRLQDSLAEAQLASATRAAALDQLCHATVITTADGTIVFANDAATRLERSGGLMLTSDGVSCADRREAARLASLIDSAARGGPGGNTRISRGPKRPILAAAVSPLPVSLADGVHVPAAHRELALVTIRDLGATSDAGQAALIELFGLTGAEAAIVPQLLAGDSMSMIAQSRGVSAATVRAQATRLLDKTGAANLRALATMIAALGCG